MAPALKHKVSTKYRTLIPWDTRVRVGGTMETWREHSRPKGTPTRLPWPRPSVAVTSPSSGKVVGGKRQIPAGNHSFTLVSINTRESPECPPLAWGTGAH